jgi:hypothetical protein
VVYLANARGGSSMLPFASPSSRHRCFLSPAPRLVIVASFRQPLVSSSVLAIGHWTVNERCDYTISRPNKLCWRDSHGLDGPARNADVSHDTLGPGAGDNDFATRDKDFATRSCNSTRLLVVGQVPSWPGGGDSKPLPRGSCNTLRESMHSSCWFY